MASVAVKSSKAIYDNSVELDLIHRAKKGDEAAFTALYHAHHSRVFVTINRVLANDDVSEWLANLVMTKAFNNLRGYTIKRKMKKKGTEVLVRVAVPGFHEESKFSTWLTRIAINEARMHLRTEKRRSHDVSLDNAITTGLPSNGQPAMDASTFGQRYLAQRDLELEGIADRQVLETAINRVPTQFREVLRLKFWEGLSIEEIQKKISVGEPKKVSISAVKSRILRGRAVLMQQVEKIS